MEKRLWRAASAASIAALLWWNVTGTAGAATCVVVCAGTPSTTPTSAAPMPSTTVTTVAPTTTPDVTGARARLLGLVNAERVQRGLAPLAARADIEGIASGWSDAMATAGDISHDDAYFTRASHDQLGAAILGENVARAVDVDQAHAALMASEHHRDNILDARFAAVGIGATYHDGWWWITEDFLQPRVASAPAPRVATVATPAAPPVGVATPPHAPEKPVQATDSVVAQATLDGVVRLVQMIVGELRETFTV